MDRFDKFTDRARKVLTLAQDEAQRFNHNYIGTEHLLLGLVREGEGVAALTLAELGVELDNVRQAVVQRLGGRGTARRAAEARGEARGEAQVAGPLCPECSRSLAEGTALQTLALGGAGPSGEERQVVLVYCEACGRTLGVLPP